MSKINKVLLIGCSPVFGHSKGRMNNLLKSVAKETLEEKGIEVKVSEVCSEYSVKEEVEKILWADLLIYQFPAWWMGTPWHLKKYIDEVFTEGHGKLYASDGRTQKKPSEGYGTAGLLNDKKYMISMTWNAPKYAFADGNKFFDGKNLDDVLMPLHKTNQFLGMSALETFTCHDVMKNPNVEEYIADYKKHLHKVLI